MKSSLVFAFFALSASAAAAASDPVVGSWRALPIPSAMSTMAVHGVPQVLTFTADGKLWVSQRVPAIQPSRDQLLGLYLRSPDGRIVARGPDGETYAYELMKDGRLCVFPGPGMVPLAGAPKTQDAGRQCYARLNDPA